MERRGRISANQGEKRGKGKGKNKKQLVPVDAGIYMYGIMLVLDKPSFPFQLDDASIADGSIEGDGFFSESSFIILP